MQTSGRVISWEELSAHANRQSLWVMIEGNVYDVTTYLAEHPGGDDILISYAGTDATEKFQSVNHTAYAKSLRDARLVGAMTSDPMPSGYLQNIKKQKRTLMGSNPNKIYSWEEVAKHNSKEDLWIVIDGRVYDVTDFSNDHPGGPAVLNAKAGDDATLGFRDANHSKSAQEQLKQYQVGVVSGKKPKKESSDSWTSQIIFFVLLLVGLAGAVILYKSN